ncbi:hypothetical protein Hanom_Chr01g00019481 [Helianthus anomalus]
MSMAAFMIIISNTTCFFSLVHPDAVLEESKVLFFSFTTIHRYIGLYQGPGPRPDRDPRVGCKS